jgi:hypothetical protein
LDLRPVRFLAVGHGQSVGVALGKEAGVSVTVVADRDGSSAEVDDLDEVGMAGLVIWVVVVASMDRVDSAGGHLLIGPRACRVSHRTSPSGGRVPASIEPLSDAPGHRVMGRTPATNGGAWVG